MNLFEDLVEDLKKENLLDDTVNTYNNVGNNIFVYKSSKSEKTPNLEIKESSRPFDDLKPKVSNFTLNIQPQIDSFANEISAKQKNSLTETEPVKKLRKTPTKNKRKSRYCKNCLVAVPHHRLTCRFCGEKIAGSYFYYYLTLIPAILLFLGIIAVFIIKN